MSWFENMMAKHDAARKPKGGTLIELHNPGNKLILYLGRPIRIVPYNCPELEGEWQPTKCLFNLPDDWYEVNEQGPYGKIVARQRNTNRYVGVSTSSIVPMSEVYH